MYLYVRQWPGVSEATHQEDIDAFCAQLIVRDSKARCSAKLSGVERPSIYVYSYGLVIFAVEMYPCGFRWWLRQMEAWSTLTRISNPYAPAIGRGFQERAFTTPIWSPTEFAAGFHRDPSWNTQIVSKDWDCIERPFLPFPLSRPISWTARWALLSDWFCQQLDVDYECGDPRYSS